MLAATARSGAEEGQAQVGCQEHRYMACCFPSLSLSLFMATFLRRRKVKSQRQRRTKDKLDRVKRCKLGMRRHWCLWGWTGRLSHRRECVLEWRKDCFLGSLKGGWRAHHVVARGQDSMKNEPGVPPWHKVSPPRALWNCNLES